MANVFTSSNEVTNKPNRNTFPLNFTNNLTLKMGQITPCFLQDVVPGDTARINPSFGFNFMPMTFPVQTKIRANVHFFYVRNRALWRGWESFITKTENEWNDNTPPYILLTEENRDMIETGKIGDYLNIPTVTYSKSYIPVTTKGRINVPGVAYPGAVYATTYWSLNNYAFYRLFNDENGNEYSSEQPTLERLSRLYDFINSEQDNYGQYPLNWPIVSGGPSSQYISLFGRSTLAPNSRFFQFDFASVRAILGAGRLGANNRIVSKLPDTSLYEDGHFLMLVFDKNSRQVVSYVIGGYGSDYSINGSSLRFYNSEMATDSEVFAFNVPLSGDSSLEFYFMTDTTISATIDYGAEFSGFQINAMVDGRFGLDNKYRSFFDLPFASTSLPNAERITALPFRAVDACYNAFYRDIRNNPFIKDGKPLYNKWVWSNEGGADTRHYQLYRANWEQDAYTTAVQSPQQGSMPPLVGVTSTGRMTFADEEGNTYTAQATFGEDGETITGISTHSSDMPVGTLRALVDTISSGISINDFRNVNAYQVWLERNMRKGLRYKDQIMAHFGTSPTYSELQMPEFIGGISRVVDMRAITQTSGDNTGAPLGTLAGQASLIAETKEYISKYCDEHGWIIGFISFVPVPIYTQLLPKMLTRHELFDYYFPEFANIGFQPILNKELAILQTSNEEGKMPNDVFGYQRAWYEYLQRTDEAHGEFRSSMKNYIIHRTYDGVPELSSDFLTVSPDEANEVFAVQSNTDKIFGQMFFDFSMKRPMPKHGIPSLKVD